MSVTVVRCLVQADGMAQRQELSADLSEMRSRSWSSDAHRLRQHHERPIPVNIEHRRQLEIGELTALYRNVNGDVYASANAPAETACSSLTSRSTSAASSRIASRRR